MSTTTSLRRTRRPARHCATAGLTLLLVLAGSTDLAKDAESPSVAPVRVFAGGPAGDAATRVEPVSLSVPRIAARSSLMPLWLGADGSLETPPVTEPMQAGWYAPGPAPGQTGPAVIVGHTDGNRRPGIFHRLPELVTGDEILVNRADSSVLRFVVTHIRQAPKSQFPTAEVYGPTSDRELRLITCGGQFDRNAKSYRDNVIVFAALEGELS